MHEPASNIGPKYDPNQESTVTTQAPSLDPSLNLNECNNCIIIISNYAFFHNVVIMQFAMKFPPMTFMNYQK